MTTTTEMARPFQVTMAVGGAKYHRKNCPTLANTRIRLVSLWYVKCGFIEVNESRLHHRPVGSMAQAPVHIAHLDTGPGASLESAFVKLLMRARPACRLSWADQASPLPKGDGVLF